MPWHAQLVMIANGEYRPPETTDLLKAMGLVDGMTDLILFLPAGRVRLIEVKLRTTADHAATDVFQDQRELHDELRYLDHIVDIVRGFDELWAIVEEEGLPHRLVATPTIPVQETLDLHRKRRRRVPLAFP